jgi:hypothetical protein
MPVLTAFVAVVANVARVARVALVAEAAEPVVFWLNVGHVNVPVLKLPDVGVPNTGVVKDGLVDRTTDPVPVDVVTPVPPLATGKVPVTPVESGNPVALVNTPDAGVPNAPPA